jgi:hypothetical protein
MVNPARFVASARIRSIAYWSATVIIAAELALGGVWDVVRIEYVRSVLERQLGYPAYFAVIALASWALRPSPRRDLAPSGPSLFVRARSLADR